MEVAGDAPRSASTPTPAEGAAAVEVDGETVLLDKTTGALHRLNAAGAAIWSRLDGSRTVNSIAAELSDVFEAEPSQVQRDVHQFLTDLAGLGLVEPGDGWTARSEPVTLSGQPSGSDSWNLDAVWVDWYTAQAIDALRSRRIEAILLKGPAIRRWLYRDDPERRGYLDADLLVETGALEATATVLAELGFRRAQGVGMERINLWADTWRREPDGAVVDLHRTLHGCEYSGVDPWPIVRSTAVEEEVGGTPVLLPSLPVRALQILLVSPADRPWQKWDDRERALEQLPLDGWRAAAVTARALGVERQFGYRLSQLRAGTAWAERIGVPTAPGWWLRWETDPALRWVALLAELPGWRARLRLAGNLTRPPSGYSHTAWALHVLGLLPGGIATLLRSVIRTRGGAQLDGRARASS